MDGYSVLCLLLAGGGVIFGLVQRLRARRQLAQMDRMLDRAAGWDAGETEAEPLPLTRESFLDRLTLDAVQMSADGAFTFWFSDAVMLWPHSVRVTGRLDAGPEAAGTEEELSEA